MDDVHNLVRIRIQTIKDISSQFVDDVNVILEQCGNCPYVIVVLSELVRILFHQFLIYS